jgi:Dolichyl-phosphate-mannose-protein mannosyltransferase
MGRGRIVSALLAAALVLTAAAWLRGAEYDEQYTLFLTGEVARPTWPAAAITAGEVRELQAAHAGIVGIAHDLRSTDVHPPLYFWAVAEWRRLAGDSLFAARMASVLFSIATLSLVGAIARSAGIPVAPAVLLTVGCYGFAYTGAIARGFALAQMLSVAGIAVLLGAERRASRMLAAGALLGAATFANYLAVFTACAVLLHTFLRSLRVPHRPSADPPWTKCISRGAARQQTFLPFLLVRHRLSADPLCMKIPARARSRSCFFLRAKRFQGQARGHARNPHRGAQRDGDCFASLAMTAGAFLAGFALWLPADLWFFLAQRQSRTGQFAPFEVIATAARLAQYAAAALFGGLPLYVDGTLRTAVTAALAVFLFALIALIVRRWRHIATPEARLLFAMAAVAPPIGLLLLGFAFNNAPIELRYLAFATPFIGLLLAAAQPRPIRHAVLAIQAIALLGLMTRAETMQPARATAIAAASLAGDGVVLLPRGNDGVGIVGSFAVEAPPTLRLLVIDRDVSPPQIRARASGYPRATLAMLGQDEASRATLSAMRQAFADPCWRAAGGGFNVLAFDRICEAE